MRWTLPLWILLTARLSSQDLVTLAPEPDTPEETTPAIEPAKATPTIRSLHITSDVKYRYATTLVSSRVVNPHSSAGEAAFSITLPESAFISEFLMEIKGKEYNAYVKGKEKARQEYDQAVQGGQTAAHVALDARDSNQFTVSVNIEAHGKVTFNLTYEQLLSRNLGVYTNIININPQQIVDDMSITVNIEEPTLIKELAVPELQTSNEALPDNTKKITEAKIEEVSPTHKRIVWTPTPEEQKHQNSTGVSGQFIVKYDVDRADNPQQILVDEGYFVHFFAPENLPKLRKHVVFVLDYSGSMDGRKLDQLKDAMQEILSRLTIRDYFSLVIFQSFVEVWSPYKTYSSGLDYASRWVYEGLSETSKNIPLDHDFVVEATPKNIDLAQTYLRSYSELGATNIMGGLRTGLKLVDIGSEQWENESDPPQPVVVFLTDGQPNVEEDDTDTIIDKTKPLNTKGCPIFSLAFGYGADYNFLRKLSLSNNGFARNIYEAADASEQLKNFYQTIASPLLSNVTFEYLPGQVDNATKTKIDFPVYFKGSELVVAGKINKDSVEEKTAIGVLSCMSAEGDKSYPIVIDHIPRPPTANRTLGHLEKVWAYLTIQQLLDKADSLDNNRERDETNEKALNLALQYSFVTPLTSLVVVKPNETESSVDTTKVKPGLDSGPQTAFAYPSYGGGGISSAGLSGAPMYSLLPPPYLPSALSVSYLSPMAPMPAQQSYSVSNLISGDTEVDGAEALSTQLDTDYTLTITTTPVKKISLNEVKWLQEYLTNSTGSDDILVSVQDQEYYLSINKTDESFGSCQVNGETGQCHHFQYCVLDVFQDDVSLFLPYQCDTMGIYLKVCCPQSAN